MIPVVLELSLKVIKKDKECIVYHNGINKRKSIRIKVKKHFHLSVNKEI